MDPVRTQMQRHALRQAEIARHAPGTKDPARVADGVGAARVESVGDVGHEKVRSPDALAETAHRQVRRDDPAVVQLSRPRLPTSSPRLPEPEDVSDPFEGSSTRRTPVSDPLASSSTRRTPISDPLVSDGSPVSDPLAREDQEEQSATAPLDDLSEEERRQVDDMKRRDAEVRRHEMAHATVGGPHTGSPRYDVERGPDGQMYAVAGNVAVDVSPVPGDPEATLRKMEQVRRAALAPADPSPQDRRVAAQAEATASKARRELREDATPAGDVESRDDGELAASADPPEASPTERSDTERSAMVAVMSLHAKRAYPTMVPPRR